MNEPELKSAAFFLAEHTPRHLNQPTTPPIHWDLEGNVLRVLLADGREVRAPLADLKPKPIHKEPVYSRPGTQVINPVQVPTPAKKIAGKK